LQDLSGHTADSGSESPTPDTPPSEPPTATPPTDPPIATPPTEPPTQSHESLAMQQETTPTPAAREEKEKPQAKPEPAASANDDDDGRRQAVEDYRSQRLIRNHVKNTYKCFQHAEKVLIRLQVSLVKLNYILPVVITL